MLGHLKDSFRLRWNANIILMRKRSYGDPKSDKLGILCGKRNCHGDSSTDPMQGGWKWNMQFGERNPETPINLVLIHRNIAHEPESLSPSTEKNGSKGPLGVGSSTRNPLLRRPGQPQLDPLVIIAQYIYLYKVPILKIR